MENDSFMHITYLKSFMCNNESCIWDTKLLNWLHFGQKSLKLPLHKHSNTRGPYWAKSSCIINGVCRGDSTEYLTRLGKIISYTLMIHAWSSLCDMMSLRLLEKSFSLSLCSLSVQIRQILRLAGLQAVVCYESTKHTKTPWDSKTNIRVQPHQKTSTVTIDPQSKESKIDQTVN